MDVWEYFSTCAKPVVLYGMGDGADKIASQLERRGIVVCDYFASDGFVRGQTFRGKTVLSFSDVKQKYGSPVIALAFGSAREDVIGIFEKLDAAEDLRIPDVPVYGDELFDGRFCTEHRDELDAARSCFADARSREVFSLIVEAKLTGSLSPLLSSADCHWYDANSPIARLAPQTYVDLGAYRGDTVAAALRLFPSITDVCAVEPEPKTCRKLRTYCETLIDVRAAVTEAAVWKTDGERYLAGDDNRGASLLKEGRKPVRCVTVDSLLSDNRLHADLIKYDVEGAEKEALEGSLATIRRDRPTLVVSAYHKSEDLFVLPLWLKEHLDGYHFVLRRARSVPAWDIEIYAIPQEKETLL